MARGRLIAAVALTASLLAQPAGVVGRGSAAEAATAVRGRAPVTFSTSARPRLPRPSLGVSDGRVFGSVDASVRDAGIAVAQQVGARYVRLPLNWSSVVADQGFTRPPEATVPLSDPANPTYRWGRIDAALRTIAAAGMTPMVYFMGAPEWAESAPRYPYAATGTWAPRPDDLADFASAVARRYDGTYRVPGDATPLPRLRFFQTWNEPNLARYLQPQWVPTSAGTWVPFAAQWYARMHAAAYAAIHARQPDAEVGLAGLAPTGTALAGAARTAPLRFLRGLLCVGDGARPDCGSALRFDAIALHPLSTTDPDRPATDADDIAVADLQPKLAALMASARRAGRLPSGAHPALWITELNWTSADAGGVLVAQQGPVVGRAILRLQQAGASIVNWQFVTDPAPDRTDGEARPAGLTVPAVGDPLARPGHPKAFLAGFAFPTAAFAVGPAHAYVWALLPVGAGARPDARGATVERLAGGRWHTLTHVRADGAGVVAAVLRVPLGATLRVVAGGHASTAVRVQRRLGRVLARSPITTRLAMRARAAALATRAEATAVPAISQVSELDPRPADPSGPGVFGAGPPALPGGGPPPLLGQGVVPSPLPSRRNGGLTFAASGRGDVIIGSSAADVLRGSAGDDLLIGLGGADRFVPGGGRDLVVRPGSVLQR